MDKSNFKKPVTLAFGWHAPGLKILNNRKINAIAMDV